MHIGKQAIARSGTHGTHGTHTLSLSCQMDSSSSPKRVRHDHVKRAAAKRDKRKAVRELNASVKQRKQHRVPIFTAEALLGLTTRLKNQETRLLQEIAKHKSDEEVDKAGEQLKQVQLHLAYAAIEKELIAAAALEREAALSDRESLTPLAG